MDYIIYNGELYHHGVKGMKWGHRKARYDQGYTSIRQTRKDARAAYRSQVNSVKAQNKQAKALAKAQNAPTPEQKAALRKKIAIAGTVAAGTALAAVGAYKLNKYVKTKNCQIAAKAGADYAEKMFSSNVKGATSGPGRVVKGMISANSGKEAADWARRASSDNFRTAAKNVYNYRKTGGDLKGLESVVNIARRRGSYINFG